MSTDKRKIPLFSVIVPVYNNEKELERCVDSILAQLYQDFELILVDDGSTDSTPLICDRFTGQDGRVRVIHKAHEGAAAARNAGLFDAVGRYIYYVDGDDWISERLLQEASDILSWQKPPDIFVFGHEMICENGQHVSYPCFAEPGMYGKERLERDIYPQMMYPRGKKTWMPVVSSYVWDKIFLRELLMEHYCKDESLFMGEDSVCAYECIYFAEQVYFSSEILYYYDRSSASSMHGRYHEDLFENYRRRVKYLRKHLGGRGDQAIERQINKIEYDGIYDALWQEVRFRKSVRLSSVRVGRKLRKIKRFPVCPVEGLTFVQKVLVIMLSIRLQGIVLLCKKCLVGGSGLKRKIKM